MIIINKDSKDIENSNNYIALGSFDGLHMGHLSLIYKVVIRILTLSIKNIIELSLI